jgi:hypothetical protein
MPGSVSVGTPPRIRHIPLSWPVEKARSNHQPKFRPVGDNLMRGRERQFNALLLEMFAAFPLGPALQLAAGEIDAAVYLDRVLTAVEPYRNKLGRVLQEQFNESALNMQDRIRGDINRQLRRFRSPARLTDASGAVTKRAEFGTLTLERSEWSPIGIEAFNDVSAESVRYATEQSGTLVTNMAAQQQVLVRDVIGSSFTTSQTFQAVGDFSARTVTGLTRQQTSQALMEILHAVEPGTPVGQSLAASRLVNVNGLTARYENAVARFAERTATGLAQQGKSATEAGKVVRKKTQKYADKLRRSRARMIARTEIKTAQVQGQLAAMRQAIADGLADPATAQKTWVTGATDVCSTCSSLAGKSLLLDRSFEGVGDGPPAHPNCRCDLDFSTSLNRAPVAVDGGNPAMPLGSEQNPIVYRFPSGFQTKPSATTGFTPPSLPAAVGPPQATAPPEAAPQPTARPELPPRPAPALSRPAAVQVEPAPPAPPPAPAPSVGSNADLVWDDAGRKWADLTDVEREFLFDSHVDEIVRNALDDIVGVHSGIEVAPVTRPSLPKPPPTAIKAIYRQGELVDELKAQERAARAVQDDMGLVYGPGSAQPGQFNPTGWRDQFFSWADDSIPGEGFVAGEGNAGFVRVLDAGERGTSIPGSNRRLIVGERSALLDPDAPIDVHDILDGMKRLFPNIDSLPARALPELEQAIVKMGTMVRTEATARAGTVTEVIPSWVTARFPGATATFIDDLAPLAGSIHKLGGRFLKMRGHLDEALDEAGAMALPPRSVWGRRPKFANQVEELEYLAVWEPLEQALAAVIDDALISLTRNLDEATTAAMTKEIRARSAKVQRRLQGAFDPMDEMVTILDETIAELRLIFPDTFDDMAALELFQIEGGYVNRQLGGIVETRMRETVMFNMAEGEQYVRRLPEDAQSAVIETIRKLMYAPKGSDSYAVALTKLRVKASITRMTHDLGKALSAGDMAAVDQLLLGQLSRISADTADDLRLVIGEVLREVRLIGGEVFDYQTGLGGGYKVMTPRVKEALASMNEAVEDWMPTDWIVRSNERGSIGFYGRKERASYLDLGGGGGLIDIGPGGPVPMPTTMLHEIFHRGQRATPFHDDLERQFVIRRVEASPAELQALRAMDDLRPGAGYETYELAYEDEFLSPYIGKDYAAGYGSTGITGGEFREVTPMAIQELTGRHLAGGSGKSLLEGGGGDLDMIDWIIGMLAGL